MSFGSHPDFYVLLGPDYAGKSTMLTALAGAGWQCVSYDDNFVPADCPLILELRNTFVTRALRHVGTSYSPDFVLTLLQTSVVYLRDQILRADPDRPVIVDSYYYKILAKCLLKGLVNEQIFGWWRQFPQPRRVIYLDVSPENAWRRSGEGTRLNLFEHYGDNPNWAGFRRFQSDLAERMTAEVAGIPLTVVDDAEDQLGRAVRAIARSDGVTAVAG